MNILWLCKDQQKTGHPKANIFVLILNYRLYESLKGLNSYPAYSAGESWPGV